jgi:hypothetical protein
MRYMANSRPGPGVTTDQLVAFFADNVVSRAAWDLVRQRVVAEIAIKTGEPPGIVLFLDVDSPEQAAAIVNGFDAVKQGLLSFELDPIGENLRL